MKSSIRELTLEEVEMVSGGDNWTAWIAGTEVVLGSIALGAAITAATPVALVGGAVAFFGAGVAALYQVWSAYGDIGFGTYVGQYSCTYYGS